MLLIFFFFNDTATTEIYTLSLHDALPIFIHLVPIVIIFTTSKSPGFHPPIYRIAAPASNDACSYHSTNGCSTSLVIIGSRSEEHTSELQSPCNLVCRLLLEKKNYSKLHMS